MVIQLYNQVKKHLQLFFRRIRYTFGHLTVHGPSFLVRKDVHFVWRFIYFVIYIHIWIAAFATIHKYYEHYQEGTIRFTTRTDYLDWNTTFPSITVCETANVDKISTDSQGFSELQGGKFDRFLAEIIFYTGTCYSCLTACKNESACRINYSELTKNVRTPCDKLFMKCMWNGKPIKCCKYFQPLETEYGKCFSINNKHSKRIPRMLYTSAHAKQSQTVNSALEITVSQDYEVFIHSPEDIPFWNMEYDRKLTILYGSQATIIFSTMDVVNEPEVSLIAPKIRQCRFPYEFPENFIAFNQYSYSVCIIQCRIETQLNLCNCTHHLSPAKYKNQYCDLEGLKCLTRHHRTLRKLQVPGRNEIGLNCDCLPSCTEPDYNVIRKKLLQPDKLLRVRPTTFELSNMPYERVTRQVARTTLDLVVAMGNCFGLCFGGSLLSIVEVAYYLCFRRWKYT